VQLLTAAVHLLNPLAGGAASTRVTQLLYDPYIVPLFAFNFTRCNAESTNVNADCTWTKSTLPLVEPKSYVKARPRLCNVAAPRHAAAELLTSRAANQQSC
jgi:hypothetical protein